MKNITYFICVAASLISCHKHENRAVVKESELVFQMELANCKIALNVFKDNDGRLPVSFEAMFGASASMDYLKILESHGDYNYPAKGDFVISPDPHAVVNHLALRDDGEIINIRN